MAGFNRSDFFFNVGLYQPVKITEEDMESEEFRSLFSNALCSNFHGFNPSNEGLDTSFFIARSHGKGMKMPANVYSEEDKIELRLHENSIDRVIIRCVRTNDEFHYLLGWDYEQMQLVKYGQSTSIADFHSQDFKKYSRLISKDTLSELKTSVRLFAHGVGIGSFIYLRRVMETLINETYDEVKGLANIPEEKWRESKIKARIGLLSDYLPPILVQNKSVYGILSRGVHELDEDTCLMYFKAILAFIKLILDEKLRLREEEINKENILRELGSINQALNTKK